MTGKLLKIEANGPASRSDSVLKAVQAETSFHDITLACDDHGLLGANKVILCSKSRFFHRVLREPANQKPFLRFLGISLAHLTSAVQFLYLGQRAESLKDSKQ